ncbi:MAG: thioredoxin family protein [Planctomycetes bacterium]|nr:thioredoxin family protein [Planctomycetota bacterium]
MNDTMAPRAVNKPVWLLLLMLAASFMYLAVSSPSADLSDWGDDLDDALRESSKSGHPVLVAFYMPGCTPCRIMDRTVLSHADVKRTLQDFVPVRLDATVRTDLARRYEVQFTPTFAVVDSHGRLLSKCEGTLTIEEFVQFLKRASGVLTLPRGAGT